MNLWFTIQYLYYELLEKVVSLIFDNTATVNTRF